MLHKGIEKNKDILIMFGIMLTGVLFLSFFKLKHSMNFINLDELLWMYRSRFFIDRLLDYDFSNLIQSSQPGIMVMWIVGPFMKIINYDFASILDFVKSLGDSGIPYNVINSHDKQLFLNYKEISFIFNIPVLAVIASFFFAVYFLLRRLNFSRWSISFSLLLIATTPYYVYFTTPTDKFVGIFATLSLLSLLVYAERRGGGKYLVFSAVFASWAVLTKLSALFLVPFSLFILLFYKIDFSTCGQFVGAKKEIVNFRKWKNNIKHIRETLLNSSYDYSSWLVVFFASCVIFLPAIITDPLSILNFFLNENSQRSIMGNYDILLNLKIMIAYLLDSSLLSFNVFVLAIFMGFIFLIIKRTKNGMIVDKKNVVMSFYPLFFFLFITFFSRTYSFRYMVPVLLAFQIAAGEGIFQFSNILSEKWKVRNKKEIYLWALMLIFISQALLIYYSELEKIENLPSFN